MANRVPNPFKPGKRPHARLTPERKRIYLETLARTGSKRHAAATASQHLLKGKQVEELRSGMNCGEQVFYDHCKRDPEFAAAVEAAMVVAIGSAENMLRDRMATPDRRPIFAKDGTLLGHDENWRSANALLLRFLERQDNAWVQKRNVESNQQITINGGTLGSGANYVIQPNDILLLPPEKRVALVELLEEIEQGRAANESADTPPLALPPADATATDADPDPDTGDDNG